ncbi:putative tRNA/rRNA methyltransferase YsgA [Oceanobacillus oncorhynchi subsp. incaldanensis]|uniref:Putative TrmH family tRNA/rRNA methyltransferase n=1 Tax=Oceanobacillus oncorhynchi TaxID=545501 RepID=A0A0A1MX17_9BACI|nr:RNA methyltransferase [Oceanobacillus oncorhynchi]MDM8100515.1 RNA methyltransferase [Oceanobacillus oncorhynchi]UUI38283.1 RNA methyltransferase [Oceanobacillus oncorhynchi]GIO16994.1 putative tRNA/rRNA methyltransferase YsgA [Oceanobacillus oncorhynchi subsp. incaldanensis]CEI83952.1 Putative TrmH family tRNA/rRNA methyltransferase [Oceanobacillus oncorhynchi]
MITSVKNEKIKGLKKLHQRKYRKQMNAFLVEGEHLIEEALTSDWEVKELIVSEEVAVPDMAKHLPVTEVTKQVFKELSFTASPQGMMAVVEIKKEEAVNGEVVVLLDAVQDPGNAGTIIRTADAAGADGIILGSGCVDLYNDKVIRATQGSIFHLPIIHADLEEKLLRLKEADYRVWATALEKAENYKDLPIPQKTALIFGNEGAGVKESLLEKADERVTIPILGKAESLNVSIAAGVLLYYLKN